MWWIEVDLSETGKKGGRGRESVEVER